MERSNFLNLAVISGTICLILFTPTLWADIIIDDFSSDLSGWDDSYGVSIVQEKAIFSENSYDEISSKIFYLEQEIDVDAGLQELSFDIFIDSGGGETDHFDVTLGSSNIYHWDSSDGSLLWTTITRHINTGTPNLRFAFNFDFHDTYAYTFVELDNVRLTPVPSAVILGSLGLTFSGWLLRKRKML